MRAPVTVPRPGRGLLLFAAVVLVVSGATAALIISLGTPSKHHSDTARASFPGFHLSFGYPSSWQRRDWCWVGPHLFPLTLLSTGDTPDCQQNTLLGEGTPLPPQLRVGRNGVAAWWLAADRAGSARFEANTTVDGRRARVVVKRQSTRRTSHSYVNCAGKTQRFLTALILGPSPSVNEVQLGAVICGPDFATGEAQVRRMLASFHFRS
ncbi:MAG TPA: hypothetical protein VJ814_07375 [Gaiellaceae bacterium]|nr:hypothetical protein [Gaiellaceae bacterium]